MDNNAKWVTIENDQNAAIAIWSMQHLSSDVNVTLCSLWYAGSVAINAINARVLRLF